MGKKTAPNISMLIIRRSPKLHREKLAILLILVMKIAAATTTLSKKRYGKITTNNKTNCMIFFYSYKGKIYTNNDEVSAKTSSQSKQRRLKINQ